MKNQQASTQAIADFLGVSRGKVQAWNRGQRPNSDDLELIARKLGFSARWLLLREGEPMEEGAPAQPQPGVQPGGSDPLSQAMDTTVRHLRAANASNETIQNAILALVRSGQTRYPEAEDKAPYPDKKLAG